MIFNSQGAGKVLQFINGGTITPGEEAITLPGNAYTPGDVVIEAVDREAIYQDGYNAGHAAGYEEAQAAALPYSQELSYIASTGTQYVNVRIQPNNNIRVVMKFKSSTASASLFGAQTAWGSASFSFGTNTATFGANTSTSIAYNDGKEHIVDFNKGVLKVDGSTVYNWSGSFSIPYNLFILANNEKHATTYYSTANLYYCQIYDNGTLVRDYIPVLDKSGVACLYDRVEKQLEYNQGSGEFAYAA